MHVEILIVTIFPLWFLNISSFKKKKREREKLWNICILKALCIFKIHF